MLARSSVFAGAALRAAPARSTRARATRAAAVVASADRPVWYPGNDAPAYLDGSLAGDYGFDPLGLGSDPELLKWFVQAELQNARWAMLAVPGCLVPEAITKAGVAELPIWSEAGAAEYYADPVTLTIIMFILFNWAEVARYRDIKNPGYARDPFNPDLKLKGTEVGYPGWDYFGLATTPESYAENKKKEIKNGRLAMLAFLGFGVQAVVYPGQGPLDNLLAHIADPGHANFFSL